MARIKYEIRVTYTIDENSEAVQQLESVKNSILSGAFQREMMESKKEGLVKVNATFNQIH